MKIKMSSLRKILKEAGGPEHFSFEVYGTNDETYTCTATYNPRTPYEVEVWKAVDETGQEVDLDDLRAMGIELEEKAFDQIGKDYADEDGIGPDYDDLYGKSDVTVNPNPVAPRVDLRSH